mmetsp:Transcript_8252/g.13627  ORF Transcript_8252/g.13627 Transcript_8252/m.13627 type:complete len:330 (+) Transcript_8252:209-1198(+)
MRVGQHRLLREVVSRTGFTCRYFSDGSSSGLWQPHRANRVHLIFGANTDVGKSVISSGLVRAAASAGCSGWKSPVNYIKPLQCGGSDESFVLLNNDQKEGRRMNDVHCRTLFSWKTPASPHLVSRWENAPVCDEEVVSKLAAVLRDIENTKNDDTDNNLETASITTIIESAGGVLSPSSSSPLNRTTTAEHWGWSTQADLYAPLRIPVVFVGDGKLGGISVTLSSLEALWARGYRIDAVVFIEGQSVGDESGSIEFGKGNAEALREYMSMRHQIEPSKKVYDDLLKDDDAIVCMPTLPPMPIPLDEWYRSNEGSFMRLHQLLDKKWIVN